MIVPGYEKTPSYASSAALTGLEDVYLLSGLTPNKYGDRSNAIGKRFGHLKKALGFGEKRVFRYEP